MDNAHVAKAKQVLATAQSLEERLQAAIQAEDFAACAAINDQLKALAASKAQAYAVCKVRPAHPSI
jgi:protein-arginine kinase activator protein McsA